ncbi:MAG: polysaccharide biosynthesis tyrosine autokinase [Acidocella sp.]|nr:polysaccharide biosynthesis tyrosine autokinase [Acidocella sp.]
MRHVARALRRHIRIFLVCSISVLVLGAVSLAMIKPFYTATAVVALSTQNPDPRALDAQQTGQSNDADQPETIASMIQSRSVAGAVLASIPAPKTAIQFRYLGFLCHAGVSFFCRRTSPADGAGEQMLAENNLLSALTVLPEPDSHVLDISVTADSPDMAARLADAFVTSFQTLALSRQTRIVSDMSDVFKARSLALQTQWLDAVNRADAYSVRHGLTDATDDNASTPLLASQIADMATSLSQAQAQLATAQAQADALHAAAGSGDASALIVQSEQPILVATASNLMALENERSQLSAEFGPAYPKIRALDEQISEAQSVLNSQTGTALASVGDNVVSARAEVKELTANLNQLRAESLAQSADQVRYQSLSDEATTAKNVYETYLQHANDITSRAALLEPPVTFVSHAGIPTHASFPNKPKLGAAVIILAVIAGLAGVLIRDYFSVDFDGTEDMQAFLQLPVLATIPFIFALRNRSVASHVLDAPFSRTSEAVRGLAGSLALMANNETTPRSVLVTSAGSAEGKTTLAVWLAMTVCQGEQSVLVIDGDHRRGSLMQDSITTAKPGLTDVLAGRATANEVIQVDPTTKIDFISAGSAMSSPFGAVEVARLRNLIDTLKRNYNLIVIDSPPLLAMTDGLVYGSVADQTIFVCRSQQTSRKAVSSSINRLRIYGASVAGLVVSMVDQSSSLAFDGEYSRREMMLSSRPYGSEG